MSDQRPGWPPTFDLHMWGGVVCRNVPAEHVLLALWAIAGDRHPDACALRVLLPDPDVTQESPEYGLIRFEVEGMAVIESDQPAASEGARP